MDSSQDSRHAGVLLVTGGGRGIGAATARLAARQGWSVAVNYARDSLAADTVVRAIRAEGGSAIIASAANQNNAWRQRRPAASPAIPAYKNKLLFAIPWCTT